MSLNNCDHVSRRVQKTKKEIEQLKEELQKLINRGVESQKNSQEHNDPLKTAQSEEKPEKTRPYLTNARPSNFSNITHRTSFPAQQSNVKKYESPKRAKHYNVEEAREYIRKQKEKRSNKMKVKGKESQNAVDLRKEKLRELQKKSLELVQKNINLKRERSHSRDKEKLENDHKGDKKESIKNRKIDKDERLKSNKVADNSFKSNDKAVEARKNVTENNEGTVNIDKEIDSKPINDNLPLNNNSVPDLIVDNFKHVDDDILRSPNQQVDIRAHVLNNEDAAIKIQRFYRKYRQKHLKTNRRKDAAIYHDLITNLQSVPCVRKVTQNAFDVPVWLTPKVESYPHNFINTVKRKLNFAINNQSQNRDVGTQIDLNDSKEQAAKIKEDIKRSLEESKRKERVNTDLRLFLSQKCLDLDLRKVENLNLLSEKSCDKQHSNSDSESDTSKNIPDISTESGSKISIKSILDKTSSDPKLEINIDKIKDLKLEDRSISHFEKSHEVNFIEKFCSKSADNITKRSKQTTKSRSASSITSLKDSKKNPSPLQVPNINLVASEPPSEHTNNDLKSFLEYMANMDHKKHSKSKTDSFISLPHSSTKSNTVKTELSTKSNRITIRKGDSYSSCFSGSTSSASSVPSLKRPTVTLSTSQNVENRESEVSNSPNQLSIKPGEVKCIETKSNTNQIHLKFEAELHLLNDFNESLRQFMAVEKTILDLHSKNQNNSTILQHQDTQTSAQMEEQLSVVGDTSVTSVADEVSASKSKAPLVPSINYSRGSDAGEDFSRLIRDDMGSTKLRKDRSLVSVSLDLSQLDDTINSTVDESMSNVSVKTNESYTKNAFVGFSVGMFDQLIRDEDTRIENLKTLLKIREKALLDRTKGELAWLEIQKKQLIETGQLHEASLLKKKQRGIIIKLQHEKQEMQRLKQIQKQASKERKTVLKEQRNMIKAQLSNNYTIPKIKRSVHKERRQSGPIKVYNLHRETINTETSISRRNSVAEEIIITSRSESIVGQITEDYSGDQDSLINSSARSILSKGAEDAKKSLLMKEAALQKRKKAAEELLQWHQRLLEEERKIAELEMAANTLIKQSHSITNNQERAEDHYKFKGSQLNLLWFNMTGRNEKKFNETEYYSLSPTALEKFCKEAKKAAVKTEKPKHSSDTSVTTEDSIETKYSKKSTESTPSIKCDKVEILENIHSTKELSYTSDFELHVEEVTENKSPSNKEIKTGGLENEIDKSKSTLNEIMQNISNITDEISAIYKLSTAANVNEPSATNESPKTSEVSVRTQSKPLSATNKDVLNNNQVITLTELENKKFSDRIPDVTKELKHGSENSSFKSLDDQINEILSEGAKRINNILSGRTQMFCKEELKIKKPFDANEVLIENNVRTEIPNDASVDGTDKIDSLKVSEILSDKINNYNDINKTKSEFSENHTNSMEILSENNTQTSISDNVLMDNVCTSSNKSSENNLESIITNKTLTEKSPEISKSISITVLKSNDIPKVNSLNSSVTLVKNLTELIKTETDCVCTPESKNTCCDSPGTLSCNGELLSAFNEPKVETNDGSQNTFDGQCQIADIFGKELAVEDTNLETVGIISEKISDIADVHEAESSKKNSIRENSHKITSYSKSVEDDVIKSETFNEISTKSKLKIASWSEELKCTDNKPLNQSASEHSLITNVSSAEISSKDIIKAHGNNQINKLDVLIKDDVCDKINGEFPKQEPPTEISFDINYDNNNALKSLVTSNGELENSLLKNRTVTENMSIVKSKETNTSNHDHSKNKSTVNEEDKSYINTVTSRKTKESVHEDKLEELTIKSSSIEVIEKSNKSSTLSNISSIKDEGSIYSQLNLEQMNNKIIFKPLKTLDEPSNMCISNDSNKTSNYSTHNGHDVNWEEEITNLQNKFEGLMVQNKQISHSKIAFEHSEKNDTFETTNDIESILSDNKENITDRSSNEMIIRDTSKTIESKDILDEVPKTTATEDETNISISIAELSQCEEFQDNKDSNDKKIHTPSLNNTSQSEELSTKSEVRVLEKSEIQLTKQSEIKSGEKSEVKPEGRSVEKNETKSANRSESKELPEHRSRSSGDAADFADVKKRVSEILADANSPRGDKSPRLQDIYTTTYDILSPDRSPEMGSPVSTEKDLASVTQMYGEEAEALFKKQLAIEQEIKQLEQQQKEQIPYMYMREIPNKPPPPYTPPVLQPHTSSIVPASTEQLDVIVCNIARILHNSYYKGTLETIVLTDRDKRTFSLRNNNIDKECYEYVFDLCKEIAVEHYQEFVDKPKPSWLRVNKKHLVWRKPFNELELRQHLFKGIKMLLGFEKDPLKESVITKWYRKKRDHVDEILIVESQAEESEWTNYDEDEVVVKNELTNDIMKILISETAQVFDKILKKKLMQSPS